MWTDPDTMWTDPDPMWTDPEQVLLMTHDGEMVPEFGHRLAPMTTRNRRERAIAVLAA